ncbi:MAG: ABC transporter ATP-binding protein [Spirochaetaceae bacterium]|nr:ABC transporter ATP-binding protein [Spirochaetaceae bacterium]
MNSLKKLLVGLEKRFKVSAFVAPLLIMGEVLLEVLIPLIMARIIDVGISNHDVGYVVKYGLIMILAALASLGFGVFAGKYAAVASVGFARNIRRRLFNKIQDFSFGNVDKFSTSSLITRLTTDVTNTQNTFQMIIRMCIRSPFMFVSAIIMSFYINSKMALIFLAAIPLIAIPAAIIMKKAFPRFQEMMKNYDLLNGTVQENLIGIRAVKAFVREKDEIERFKIAANAVRTTQVKAEKLVILNMPIMQLVMYLSIIAILWFGGNFIIAGSMQVGELISFITYLTQILMSLMMISMIFVMLVISKASINRIVEVLDEEVDIKSAEKSKAVSSVKDGSIKFENVSFSYDKQESTAVLRNINVDIKSGMTVGIVGGTGSSKTTFVQLIPRLYDVLSGKVEVGGVNVKDYELETLRNSVAMVLQKNVLFSGTIKENLKWGNENATDEEIIAACKAASAHDFVSSFPDGYETELGQGGVNLSGGQKQRLCIARALLKQPKILILDDSTSAVDTATDAAIRKSLASTLNNTTKIIIAQRISSIQDADVIYVLDEGEIVDFGNHEKLLETCEIYKEVYESQLKGNDFDEAE